MLDHELSWARSRICKSDATAVCIPVVMSVESVPDSRDCSTAVRGLPVPWCTQCSNTNSIPGKFDIMYSTVNQIYAH